MSDSLMAMCWIKELKDINSIHNEKLYLTLSDSFTRDFYLDYIECNFFGIKETRIIEKGRSVSFLKGDHRNNLEAICLISKTPEKAKSRIYKYYHQKKRK